MQEKLRGRQRARTLTARSEISTGLPASRFLPSHFWLILVSALLPRACLQVSQLRWSRTHTHTHSYCGDIHAASVPRQALCLYPELEIKARSFTLFFLFITESPTGMCLRMKTIMWGWNIWILKESSPEQEDALLALSDCGRTLTLSAPQSGFGWLKPSNLIWPEHNWNIPKLVKRYWEQSPGCAAESRPWGALAWLIHRQLQSPYLTLTRRCETVCFLAPK